jgi:hypothetical protein
MGLSPSTPVQSTILKLRFAVLNSEEDYAIRGGTVSTLSRALMPPLLGKPLRELLAERLLGPLGN